MSSSRILQKLLVLGGLVLVCSVLCHGLDGEHKTSSYIFVSVVMEPLDRLRTYVESIVGTRALQVCFENAVLYLDSLFGPENVYSFAMFVDMLLNFVAEGAASGLNVIAVYVSEIIRATGVSETTSIPHFSSDGVSAVIKWALLALIGYWMLSIVLRVTVGFVRRMFWLLKGIFVLWLFVRIVSDPSASNELISMRLTVLVLIYAVFGVAASSMGSDRVGFEKRIKSLEGQIKIIEKKKTE